MFTKGDRIVECIRPLVGKAQYRLAATLSEAPLFFDCSGLVQWAFEQSLDLYVPRLTANQCQRGKEIDLADCQTGDLLFTAGRSDRFNFHPPHMRSGIGHVGIISSQSAVICSLWPYGVVEISIDDLLNQRQFRCLRRII